MAVAAAELLSSGYLRVEDGEAWQAYLSSGRSATRQGLCDPFPWPSPPPKIPCSKK